MSQRPYRPSPLRSTTINSRFATPAWMTLRQSTGLWIDLAGLFAGRLRGRVGLGKFGGRFWALFGYFWRSWLRLIICG
jgi:hypothetical protein